MKYRLKPNLVIARKLDKAETIMVGPQGFEQQVKAKPGQFVVSTPNGDYVYSEQEFGRDHELEALPEDQDRPAMNEPLRPPSYTVPEGDGAPPGMTEPHFPEEPPG